MLLQRELVQLNFFLYLYFQALNYLSTVNEKSFF